MVKINKKSQAINKQIYLFVKDGIYKISKINTVNYEIELVKFSEGTFNYSKYFILFLELNSNIICNQMIKAGEKQTF